MRKKSKGVFISGSDIILAGRDDIRRLKGAAMRNVWKRARLCAHPDEGNRLHEMLIILGKGSYIRPHQHLGKSESFHVIEGCADVVLFDEAGVPVRRILLGDYQSGRCFYLRIERASFHSVAVTSETFVFHETTNGPFRREDTEFAAWSPAEADVVEGLEFMGDVLRRMEVSGVT